MKYKKRAAEKRFLDLSGFFKVVLLTGPRQVGKTTMLRHLAAGTDRSYASLDDPRTRELAKKDPAGFFDIFPPPILIDEVQYAPELFPMIKVLADAQDGPGRFWLTGSQQYSMMQHVQESLAGRLGIMQLSGMTQREKWELPALDLNWKLEALRSRESGGQTPSAAQIFELIWTGGLPSAADLGGNLALRDTFFESYLQSYIMRDIAQLGGVHELERFARFVSACAALTSQQLNSVALAEAAGISRDTAKNWLALLAGLGIVYLLPPFSTNALKRLAKRPKLYFTDTGFAAYLTGWPSPETLMKGPLSGAFFETYVVQELLANSGTAAVPFRLSYYRDQNGREIDIIMERGRMLHPLEIKQSASPRRQEVRKFSVLDRPDLERGPGGIICTAPQVLPLSDRDCIIPSGLL